MRSRILHHLEAILKTGSIAEASRQYFIAQPSLSQFVKRLEEEHRITIFDRSRSPWVLTPTGLKPFSAGFFRNSRDDFPRSSSGLQKEPRKESQMLSHPVPRTAALLCRRW